MTIEINIFSSGRLPDERIKNKTKNSETTDRQKTLAQIISSLRFYSASEALPGYKSS
jgi:hypothetical protein